jgi:hypothetical protein
MTKVQPRDGDVRRRATYRLGDYDFSIESGSDEIAELVEYLFGACRSGLALAPPETFVLEPVNDRGLADIGLHQGDARLAKGSFGVVLERLIWETSIRSIDRNGFLFVHAGVVSLDGVGIALPAPPDHGKSTLVAGLVRDGFAFLSDEAAALDPSDGTVHPFPRPVMLSDASLATLPVSADVPMSSATVAAPQGRRLGLDGLRPDALGEPAPVGLIVAPTYRPRSSTVLEAWPRADALELLVEQSFNLEAFGAAGVQLLGDVVRGADCYRLNVSDLPGAIAEIRSLMR